MHYNDSYYDDDYDNDYHYDYDYHHVPLVPRRWCHERAHAR